MVLVLRPAMRLSRCCWGVLQRPCRVPPSFVLVVVVLFLGVSWLLVNRRAEWSLCGAVFPEAEVAADVVLQSAALARRPVPLRLRLCCGLRWVVGERVG